MKDSGIKASPEVGQTEKDATTYVLEFPVKSPDGCITRKDVTALDQLKHYKNLQHNWCEHNASMTVYVRDDEWFESETKNMSEKQIAQELLCDFAASGETFLRVEDIEYLSLIHI